MSSLTPVNVLTGFLGSGKTTLLQRLLRAPQMQRTAVLINELGEVGLDHLLVQQVDEPVVLLESGCICCTIRGDLSAALRDLLSARDRERIPAFDRVVIETTGLADPGPILYTLLSEPVIQHHFALGNVITTVDAVNASLHLERNPEGIKQVAAADRLLVTKTDLVDAEQVGAVHEALVRINPAAEVWSAQAEPLDVDRLLRVESVRASRYVPAGYPLSGTATPTLALPPRGGGNSVQEPAAYLASLRRHCAQISSFSLVLAQPLDWTAFGIWLSLMLHRHGDDVLRVKGILQIQGSDAPVFLNAVQHVVHPPQHLDGWPTDDHRSRLVFITRGIDHHLLKRSLEAFCGSTVAEVALA